jgi:hypothetical protein
MELMVNDLSVNGQFPDIHSFYSAINRIMSMRELAKKYGRSLYCHRKLSQAQVTGNLSMPQIVQHLRPDQRRALMQWLTHHGPFWEDKAAHKSDDYFECNTEIVTDTAIGETAYRVSQNEDWRLVSFTPSAWELSPLSVWWRDSDDSENDFLTEVTNYIHPEVLEKDLSSEPVPIESWQQLAIIAQKQCPSLFFSKSAFEALNGLPFVHSATSRILSLLKILEKLKCSYNENGRSDEGHHLYQSFFAREKSALFSDSSDTEKRNFKQELTFAHPEKEGEKLFCPMHGKVKTHVIRIHFSTPICHDKPLYIVYVGPKITKQ